MTPCREIRARLSEFMDGAVDAKAASRIKKHLEACPLCREELASLQAVSKALGTLKAVKPPDDFLEQLHGRMASEGLLRRLFQRRFIPFGIKVPLKLASAVAAGVLIFFVFYPKQTQPPVMAPTGVVREVRERTLASKSTKGREGARTGGSAPESTWSEVVPKRMSEPLEIVLYVKKSAPTGGKGPYRRVLEDKTKPLKAVSPAADQRALKRKGPPDGAAGARFTDRRTDEKKKAGAGSAPLVKKEGLEARVAAHVVRVGGRVIDSFEKTKEKILICRIPSEALEALEKRFKALDAESVFPDKALAKGRDFLRVRVRIVTAD